MKRWMPFSNISLAANNRINDAERYAVQVSDTTKVEESFNRIGHESQYENPRINSGQVVKIRKCNNEIQSTKIKL
jgi:hypothetical protein